MSCFDLCIFRGIWYSNINRECFGDFCMTINHLDCSKGNASLLRLLTEDDQWKSWSQQNRNLLGILSPGEQDDNSPLQITINILIHIQVQRRNRGEMYGGYGWKWSAKYTTSWKIIIRIQSATRFLTPFGNKKKKKENKIIMQNGRSSEEIKPSQRYYGESRLQHAVFKIRSQVRNKPFKK